MRDASGEGRASASFQTAPPPLLSYGSPLRPSRLIAVVLVFGGLTLGACSSDGSGPSSENVPVGVSTPDAPLVGDDGGTLDDDSDQAADDGSVSATLPDSGADTPAGESDGDTDQSGGVLVVADSDDGGLSTEEWIALIALGILAVGAIIAVTAWISGRSERSGQLAAERDRQSNKVIGGARWAHDQAAMTVLATTDAAALQSTWPAIQAQLFDVEASIAASKVGDPARDSEIALVGRSVGDLRGALAADVALRLSSQGQQYELVEASRRNVLQRNDQLEQALRPLVAAQS